MHRWFQSDYDRKTDIPTLNTNVIDQYHKYRDHVKIQVKMNVWATSDERCPFGPIDVRKFLWTYKNKLSGLLKFFQLVIGDKIPTDKKNAREKEYYLSLCTKAHFELQRHSSLRSVDGKEVRESRPRGSCGGPLSTSAEGCGGVRGGGGLEE